MVVSTANKLVSLPPECEIEEVEDLVDGQFRCFKNFDVTTNPPSDHHFQNPVPESVFSCIRGFVGGLGKPGSDTCRKERILKEWELLKTGLPNSIFVRAYSARPDLMRAAVIGLEGNNNPYGYGLFFFDIMLPAQYPTKPPLVHHRFSGVGLETGRYIRAGGANRAMSCFGEEDEGSEKWDPARSSVVDALGLIQRRVWRRGQRMKGERWSEAFMLSRRAMARTLQSPPAGFEEFVRGYFRKFSHVILVQLKGHLEDVGFRSSAVGPGGMGKLTFDDLVKDFEANGSYCRHLLLDPHKL